MRKLIMLIPMLLAANSALAETTYYNSDKASKIVREGTVIAVERNAGDWYLLVNYRDVLFKCQTVSVDGVLCISLK